MHRKCNEKKFRSFPITEPFPSLQPLLVTPTSGLPHNHPLPPSNAANRNALVLNGLKKEAVAQQELVKLAINFSLLIGRKVAKKLVCF